MQTYCLLHTTVYCKKNNIVIITFSTLVDYFVGLHDISKLSKYRKCMYAYRDGLR